MELLSEAIVFATRAHNAMYRKGTRIPYILHPVETSAIVGSMTDDQEILAAAVLHDVVEDTGVTPEEIEERFGRRVRTLVMSETEDKRESLPPEETWFLRKEESVDFLRSTTDRAVKMLYLGDKLSNLRSIHRDISVHGADLWERFNQKDPEMHHWYHRSIAEATKELDGTSAWQEYNHLITLVFHERND